MAARIVEFWPSLERNFGGIGCALEAEAAVGGSTWCCLFVGDFRRCGVPGVTFSFNLILIYSIFKVNVSSYESERGLCCRCRIVMSLVLNSSSR